MKSRQWHRSLDENGSVNAETDVGLSRREWWSVRTFNYLVLKRWWKKREKERERDSKQTWEQDLRKRQKEKENEKDRREKERRLRTLK